MMKNKEQDCQKIDFVIPWVDGADPKWLEEKAQYDKDSLMGNSQERFRDWDNLKYWFRGVEEYAPWVNKIYFVTWGHVPEFLNTNHPKLKIIKHTDYIPMEFLPTYNANVIEMNLHRIKGLEENFVYFNDDTFLINPVKPTDFFVNGIPCEEAVEEPLITRTERKRISINYLRLNDSIVINRHFNKRVQLKKYWKKWINPVYGKALMRTITMLYWNHYSVFKDAHLAVAVKKSTIEKVWNAEPQLLHNTSTHKFRDEQDVNQYLIRYWQTVSGEFIPQKASGKYYALEDSRMDEVKDQLEHARYKMICLNDAGKELNFELCKQKINESFDKKLPRKSTFEK